MHPHFDIYAAKIYIPARNNGQTHNCSLSFHCSLSITNVTNQWAINKDIDCNNLTLLDLTYERNTTQQ